MSSSASPFTYTAPTTSSIPAPGTIVGGHETLGLADVSPNDLPGNGSSSSGAAGQHFLGLQQQARDQQTGIKASNDAFAGSLKAQGDAQRGSLQSDMQAMQAGSRAKLNADTSALFAGPKVTGPMLPPNFGETAQAPQRDNTPAPNASPSLGTARTPYLQGLFEAGLDGRAASFIADRYRQGVQERGGAALPSLGSVFNGTANFGAQGIRDIQEAATGIAEGLDYFRKVSDGTISLYDPETGQLSDEAIRRSLDAAGLAMAGGFGGAATRAGETVLGAGPVRTGAQTLERRGLTAPRGQIGGTPTGVRSTSEFGASPARKAEIDSENQVADRLAAQGYDVVQNPTRGATPALRRDQQQAFGLDPDKNPDLLINGRVFDTYTPVVNNTGSIRSGIATKVEQKQTDRVVLDLRGTTQTDTTVRAALRAEPVPGLREVITLTEDGLGRAFP